MEKRILDYTEWQDTADTLHLFLQMAGKVKIERSDKRPGWAHVRMPLTIDGIGTGIIPGDASSFEIYFNLRQHHVDVQNTNGSKSRIPLQDGLSVADFYAQLMGALDYIGAPTRINTTPQEFHDNTPFDQDTKHHSWDRQAVALYLDHLHFAYRCLSRFLAPFRGKVFTPQYWFGTMDLSGSVFAGQAAPYSGTDVIGVNCFDEKFVEYGFWPGDVAMSKPAFYGMPYPFMAGIDSYATLLKPDKAVFQPQMNEFILTLEDAFAAPDPEQAVVDMCRSSFEIVQRIDRWDGLDWITEPMTYPAASSPG
ncbi:DUF5996 family protein [Arthrobacter sp. Helios]|uniref:DUF5996 family protein n=1 Tax=Arthrobacter sp. Helios TaxID=2828862 RepID=UPI00204AA17A|nr:DUF5996 family protein [Arthrobacter sp. Helios]UPO77407.1 DUF5996 family protein [Arthrobacter sp. Helios]